MESIWLKHYPADVPRDVNVSLYPSLVDLLDGSFKKNAAKPAYHMMGKSLSFAVSGPRGAGFEHWRYYSRYLKAGVDRLYEMGESSSASRCCPVPGCSQETRCCQELI